MEKMKALYERVAADGGLQAKFAEIMGAAEADGKEATKEKLMVFAKEAGFEVSFEEISEFFQSLFEQNELTDAELDMAAGGKGSIFHFNLFNNRLTDFIHDMNDLGNTPVIDVFKK